MVIFSISSLKNPQIFGGWIRLLRAAKGKDSDLFKERPANSTSNNLSWYYAKPETASAILSSLWWAVCRPKHVEPHLNMKEYILIECCILLVISIWIILWCTDLQKSSSKTFSYVLYVIYSVCFSVTYKGFMVCLINWQMTDCTDYVTLFYLQINIVFLIQSIINTS